MEYLDLFINSFSSYGNYIWNEITFQVTPWYVNYFWLLTILSLLVWGLEILFPWRKNQSIFRKDFWLDTFYMYFNFYIFKLIIFVAFSNVVASLFEGLLPNGADSLVIYDTKQLPYVVQLIVFFVSLDFIQWITHRMLHRFGFLWDFHKVHHSVEEMGYAAHLRFHWMENVVYTPIKYIIMVFIGNFNPQDAFIVYYASVAIGHLNHANINLTYGPLKYIFNNPAMHIWHHAKEIPSNYPNGVNFGISLSIWDYLFKTAYIPRNGRDIQLGFNNLKKFPTTFWKQLVYPINKKD